MSAVQLETKGKIALIDFEKQLQETRFDGLNLKELLDAYFGETIRSKKEVKQERENNVADLFNGLIVRHPKIAFWLEYVKRMPGDSRWIIRLAETKQVLFSDMVAHLEKAYVGLPRNQGKLFLHLLSYQMEEADKGMPADTESINELLTYHNIYRDDLLNFVTCTGFLAEDKLGKIHPVWQAAVEMETVLNVPLRELVTIGRVYPVRGKDVWVVENSGVCSSILDMKPNTPIISTNGQFKLAALVLMDRLVKEGCTLHYSGDFDPEGLAMAQRLLDRYPQHVELWHMTREDYIKTNPTNPLNGERLAKLNGINDPNLRQIAEEIGHQQTAGYQEALVNEMMKDL